MFPSSHSVNLRYCRPRIGVTVPGVLEDATIVRGRDELLAAVGDHPYTRLYADGQGEVTGYLFDGVAVWTTLTPRGPAGHALGERGRVTELLTRLTSAQMLAGASWLHLPRVAVDALHLPVTRHDEWDFRWTATAPPHQSGEERVVVLADADSAAITALIEESFPGTSARPGDPRINRWYGIWSGGRLVACGADRSRNGVGFLAGLTVAPDLRGRGLGAALTAAMTRRLLAEYGQVALGVMVDNHRAVRLYERLGFVGNLPRTSLAVGPS